MPTETKINKIEWNWISLQFDREMQNKDDHTGEQLVPLFLDHILQDSCSTDVREALVAAFQKSIHYPDHNP